jgi:hypothetical protein
VLVRSEEVTVTQLTLTLALTRAAVNVDRSTVGAQRLLTLTSSADHDEQDGGYHRDNAR